MTRRQGFLALIIVSCFTAGWIFSQIISSKDGLSNFEFSISYSVMAAVLSFLFVGLVVTTTQVVLELNSDEKLQNEIKDPVQ